MIRWLITLLMVIAVGVLGAFGLGDGYLDFRSQAKAEQALDEARNIKTAMDAYAMKYGDGEVAFGDVAAGEDLLKYLKHFKLVQDRVGTADSTSGIDRWVLEPNSNQVMGVIASQKTCRYMNSIKDKISIDAPVPECGSVEAESVSCCQDSTGQLGSVIPAP